MGSELAAWLADRLRRDRNRAEIAAFAARWAAATPLAALARVLDTLDRPSAETVEGHIRPLLEEPDWIEPLIGALVAEAARDPFFEPPLAPVRSDVQSGLILYAGRHAAIALGVGALDRLAAKKRATRDGSIVVPGHLSLMRAIVGGDATLSLWAGGWRDGAPRPTCRSAGTLTLHDGAVLRIDGRTTSFLIDHARADIVLLHATIFAEPAPAACEYDRRTLALAGTSAASERASRVQMLTSLLGALDRPDAAAFDAASRNPESFARWHAMREWLALDADAAGPRLAEIAGGDPDAELRALAKETLARWPCLA